MKFILLSFCFLSGIQLHAQAFQWLSTGRNLNMEVMHASIDLKGNMVVAAEVRTPYYTDGKEELITIAKTVDSSKVIYSQKMYQQPKLTLISYNPTGMVSWIGSLYKQDIRLYGMQHNAKNELVLLAFVEGEYSESEMKYERGELSEEEDDSEEEEILYGDLSFLDPEKVLNPFVEAGLYALVLNEHGKLVQITKLMTELEYDLSIEGFQITKQGTYAINGTFGDDLKLAQLKNLPAKGGGDFVFVYDVNGKWVWGDAICYDKKTCCSYLADAQRMAVAPDGSIYLVGAFKQSVQLSSGKILKVAEVPTEKLKEPFESYLIAYNPQGKVKWTKQSNSRMIMQQLAASKDQVFISYRWNPEIKTAFGIEADTSQGKRLIIAAFSSSGKLNWHASHGAHLVQKMVFTQEKLYVCGATSFGSNTGVIGNYTLKSLEDSYIASYTSTGKFIKAKPLRTDFGDRVAPVHVFPVSDSEIYVAYSMFLGTRLPLHVFDDLFTDLKNSAQVAVIGKITY